MIKLTDMDSNQIRQKYLEFFKQRGHAIIPRAPMVPENDPTTLFTGSGMQPLVNYFLGDAHPAGKRITDSQTCFRAEDVDEVGDNRHTTFFEMLGNWSFGDYFKAEQLPWFFEFLTDEIGLDPSKLFVTCFIGDGLAGVGKDEESAGIWQKLFEEKGVDNKVVEIGSEADGYVKGMQDGRIFYYDSSKNWWSRSGKPDEMPAGEPGGPDSEVFYEFTGIQHDKKYGEHCHPNCECGRFIEIGNSVFMEFIKQDDGSFKELPNKNVDFGGGLERISAASLNSPDVFKISLIWPVIEKLQAISGKKYEDNQQAMRVIADHLRAGIFLATDGVTPSNKRQGYVMRRLLRRAIRYALDLGIEQGVCERIAPVIAELYRGDFPEVMEREQEIIEVLKREEKIFRQTLRKGLQEFEKMMKIGTFPKSFPAQFGPKALNGADIFRLYDTYGFPVELSIEEAKKSNLQIDENNWQKDFDKLMEQQRQRSQTASLGEFKGGLADNSELTTKLHTAAHMLDSALIQVLGDTVHQKGANITPERLRFDFTHYQKVTPEEVAKVEQIVNEAIEKNYPVSWQEENTDEALKTGAIGAFGQKYGDKVKVYYIGDKSSPFSREICGGPHVDYTGQLAEGGKKFKITKEESSSAGVRRIKAQLV
jgi:alanyl-tRNA synthetase